MAKPIATASYDPDEKPKNIREILYGYRPGFHSQISAQVAGKFLRKQERETGHLEPNETVRRSIPKKSPTHGHFEWNDKNAGVTLRLRQARDLISSTYIVVEEVKITASGEKRRKYLDLQYVHASVRADRLKDHDGDHNVSTYILVEKAAADDVIRGSILDEAMRMISGLRRRIERLSTCVADVSFLKGIENQIEKEKRRRKKGKRRGRSA